MFERRAQSQTMSQPSEVRMQLQHHVCTYDTYEARVPSLVGCLRLFSLAGFARPSARPNASGCRMDAVIYVLRCHISRGKSFTNGVTKLHQVGTKLHRICMAPWAPSQLVPDGHQFAPKRTKAVGAKPELAGQ